jgi:Ankyrin repeats (many copies)/Ankyrin repeat
MPDAALMKLIRSIVAGDEALAARLLADSPALSRARFEQGATREAASDPWFEEITHYVYAGDTALHMAAAAYRPDVVRKLVGIGADVRAQNRHGAEPLHYAADGMPGSRGWNPTAQAMTIACLIESGADPNALDKRGVAPLHRAVRTRCAAAVKALLDGGANPALKNKRGSAAIVLATRNTGRGGSGRPRRRHNNRKSWRCLVLAATPPQEVEAAPSPPTNCLISASSASAGISLSATGAGHQG